MLENSNSTIIIHNVKSNKENQTLSESMPISNSLAHLSNQNNIVNSVIQQTNQQSVIQATGEAAIQAVQLMHNNRIDDSQGQNNVICSSILDDESKRRREYLNRRPSYRRILNELSSAETSSIISLDVIDNELNNQNQNQLTTSASNIPVTTNSNSVLTITTQTSLSNPSSQTTVIGSTITTTQTDQNNNETSVHPQTSTVCSPYVKIIPLSNMQLTLDHDLFNHPDQQQNSSNSTVSPYLNPNQDASFYVSDFPWSYKVNSNEMPTHYLRTPVSSALINSNNSAGVSNILNTTCNSIGSQNQGLDDANKKREIRLMKNREAAKECRRKKKEYIKCLENRVNVLEAQNKILIDELKALKEFYCQKNE